MFITLETDYAVRIVAALCRSKGKLDARSISRQTCVPLRFALKILCKLVAAGIVKSFKGTQGGYQINMEPNEITFRMVIEATEGTYYFSRCLAPNAVCSRNASGNCSYQNVFRDITDTVRKKLDEYNFADITACEEKRRKTDAVSEEQ